jgi:hypothetical protein
MEGLKKTKKNIVEVCRLSGRYLSLRCSEYETGPTPIRPWHLLLSDMKHADRHGLLFPLSVLYKPLVEGMYK